MLSRLLRPALIAAALLANALPAGAAGRTIVFAAASLKTALDRVADAFTQATGNEAVISYAASGTLARQIEAGAPADIFISADQAWMDELSEQKLLVEGTRRDLLGNALVVVAPADEDASVDLGRPGSVAEALGADGRLSVGETNSVPAGRYARQALTNTGQWESVASRLAQAENVRVALALVARGETPLGIVYATDAKAEPGVAVVATFPESSHAPIIYPAALIEGGDGEAAKSFFDFLQGEEARAIFRDEGFTMPN